MAAVPSIEQEDAKRPTREHESLVGERTHIVNLYRPRFLRHRFEPYAASAAVGSCSARTVAGGRKPCRSMSQVAL